MCDMDRYGPEKDCSSRKIILPRGQSPPALKEVGWELEVGHVAQKVAVFRRKQMRPLRKYIDTARAWSTR